MNGIPLGLCFPSEGLVEAFAVQSGLPGKLGNTFDFGDIVQRQHQNIGVRIGERFVIAEIARPGSSDANKISKPVRPR